MGIDTVRLSRGAFENVVAVATRERTKAMARMKTASSQARELK